MRFVTTLLLLSMLMACTSTSGSYKSGSNSKMMTAQDLPEADKLVYDMGVNYIGRGEYSVADEKLMSLVKKYPKFSSLYVMLGVSQERQGKKSNAIEFYSKAMTLNPNDRTGFKQFAMIQCGAHDVGAPAKLVALANDASTPLKAGMNSAVAGCYMLHNNPAKANEYADKAIAENPKYGDSYFFKASASNQLNRPNEVFSSLDRYHDIYGYEPASVYLGLDAAKKNRNQAEISKYEEVIAAHQDK